MRIVFYVPPLRRPSGGLKNIYASAASLSALGREVYLSGPASETPGFAEALGSGLRALPWGSPLGPGDIWCIPEGWPNVLSIGHQAGARTLLYVQNWVYMLGNLPQGVSWQQLPLEYVAVSGPVSLFLEKVIGVGVLGVVPPALDEIFFQEGQRKPGAGLVRAAWMPRKNPAIGEQAMRVCEMSLAGKNGGPRLEWVRIDKMPPSEVARHLAACHLFLSTGFPEGFALPPVEAMASGCIPVGCTGFGGWEYMRQARVDGFGLDHAPPPLIREILDADSESGARGNGFYSPDGDSLAAGLALAEAVRLAAGNSPAWRDLQDAARSAAARYRQEQQILAWEKIGL